MYGSRQPVHHAIVVQNQDASEEIAHLVGETRESVTGGDIAHADFTTDLALEPFTPGV